MNFIKKALFYYINLISNHIMSEENPEQRTIKKITQAINYKVIALIAGLTIVDLIYGLYFFDGTHFDIKDGYYMAGIAGCGIGSLLISNRYRGSHVFGRAYLFLGLGFFAWFIADAGYYYNQFVLDVDPWPSPFDIGFIANYVFASMHLYLNTRYFKRKWSIPMKSVIVIIPIIAVTAFTMEAYYAWGEYDELLFDLVYSNIFVVGMAVTLAFAVLGATVFRNSVLKETWLLLTIGIFFWAVGDSVYYYLDTIEAFTHNHPINSAWTAAFMLIIYALYKHHKAI